MKKLMGILFGLILLAMTGVGLYLTGGIFDAGMNQNIFPYFFQPNNLSERRPGVPQTAEYMGDSQFLNLLVRKYVAEYFYAAPDSENIARRTSPNGALARMSAATVFDEWLANEGKRIQDLAADKAMRIAHVIDQIYQPHDSKYWVVNYELITWEKPNDFSIQPTVTHGTMYMDITYQMGMRTGVKMDVLHEYLENGGDPAAVFNFRVNQIIQG